VRADLDASQQTENIIVSQWKKFSANENPKMGHHVEGIFTFLSNDISVVLLIRANSIAVWFRCLTMAAIMSLRDHWQSGQLRDVLQRLFIFLSGAVGTLRVERIVWPQAEYDYCLSNFHFIQG